jgi:hypothetical protein
MVYICLISRPLVYCLRDMSVGCYQGCDGTPTLVAAVYCLRVMSVASYQVWSGTPTLVVGLETW